MELYKVTITHYGPESNGGGLHGFVLADSDEAVARLFLKDWELDRLDQSASARDTADPDWTYYGVTGYSWEPVQNWTDEHVQAARLLGLVVHEQGAK